VCCGGSCTSGDCCTSADCPGGLVCENNTCQACQPGQCGAGKDCCDGVCVSGDCCQNGDCPKGDVCQGNSCEGCSASTQCGGAQVCCSSACTSGDCCTATDCPSGLGCVSNICSLCTADSQCVVGDKCCDSTCVAGSCCTDADCSGGLACVANQCAACTGDAQCGTGQICQSGVCASATGCSDGTREGYDDVTDFPRVAGCAGGWAVKGMGATAACNHASGNSSSNPNGTACSVADLCTANFHVCASDSEVSASSPDGCGDSTLGSSAAVFFATQESGPGCTLCEGQGGTAACSFSTCSGCGGTNCENDLFGCGDLGNTPNSTCGVLNETSGDLCSALGAPWSCGTDGCTEWANVTKTGPAGGGVLCCAN
jgi:hypothetical protein